jgi:hypothetical protein
MAQRSMSPLSNARRGAVWLFVFFVAILSAIPPLRFGGQLSVGVRRHNVTGMKCPPCVGTGVGSSPQGTCLLCGGRGTLPDDPLLTEPCNLCVGTGIGGDSRGFCTVCGGYGKLRAQTLASNRDAPLVFFVESGQPRTAHLDLAKLFKEIVGAISICDPYYGTGTLYRLDLLRHCSPIRFLTKHADRNEQHVLPRAIQEWNRQHGAAEFRTTTSADLHDRFILSNSELILLGHGLKDVGNKDSFVVKLPASIVPDLVSTVRDSYDRKWSSATPIS